MKSLMRYVEMVMITAIDTNILLDILIPNFLVPTLCVGLVSA
jgi:hypothetical protein